MILSIVLKERYIHPFSVNSTLSKSLRIESKEPGDMLVEIDNGLLQVHFSDEKMPGALDAEIYVRGLYTLTGELETVDDIPAVFNPKDGGVLVVNIQFFEIEAT